MLSFLRFVVDPSALSGTDDRRFSGAAAAMGGISPLFLGNLGMKGAFGRYTWCKYHRQKSENMAATRRARHCASCPRFIASRCQGGNRSIPSTAHVTSGTVHVLTSSSSGQICADPTRARTDFPILKSCRQVLAISNFTRTSGGFIVSKKSRSKDVRMLSICSRVKILMPQASAAEFFSFCILQWQ